MSRRLADERGMTLIELVMSVAILGIIIGPISAAMMLGFMTNSGTRERVDGSVSAQLLSSYLTPDVQSAKYVVVPGGGAGPACTGGGTPVLRLQWDAPSSPSPVDDTIVVYERRSGEAAGDVLDRVQCTGTGTFLNRSTLVHSLIDPSTGTNPVVVSCVRDDASTACPTVPENDSTPMSPLRTVRVRITTDDRTVHDAVSPPYTFSLDADRRVTQVTP